MTDYMESLEVFLRIVIIHDECGNLKLFVDKESLLEALTKRRRQTFDKVTDVHLVIHLIGERFSH